MFRLRQMWITKLCNKNFHFQNSPKIHTCKDPRSIKLQIFEFTIFENFQDEKLTFKKLPQKHIDSCFYKIDF